MTEQEKLAALSPRERDVYDGLRKGKRVGSMAYDWNLSVKTVSTFRTRMMQKLGVRNDIELGMFYQRRQPLSSMGARLMEVVPTAEMAAQFQTEGLGQWIRLDLGSHFGFGYLVYRMEDGESLEKICRNIVDKLNGKETT